MKENEFPADSSLSSKDFLPAGHRQSHQAISRPSISYWEDAWRRFKKNKQAFCSLVIVTVLAAFTLLGPLIWREDPNAQDLNRVSIAPTLGERAVVLAEPKPWVELVAEGLPSQSQNERAPASVDSPVQNLRLLEPASTLSVRLAWDPIADSAGYLVYRNEIPPELGNYGVPIGETASREIISVEDTNGLEPKTYYYSVLAKHLDGTESSQFASLKVDIPSGITLENARALNPSVRAGDLIRLKASPLGTDSLGRDLLARLMLGGRISLFIGVAAALLYVALGVLIGGISGFFGGAVDRRIMQFTDFVTGLPFLLFMILLKVVLSVGPGESGISAMMIALVVLSWTGEARLVRGQVLQLRESEFVQAARLMGANPFYIIFRHMVPNILGLLLVSLTFGIPAAIFTEVFLSFIGLGVASPAASWGSLCTEAIQTVLTEPHQFFAPAILISITVLAFNLLGDGLRDALDPKLRANE